MKEHVHDMGGRDRFFGPLPPIDPDEPTFRARVGGQGLRARAAGQPGVGHEPARLPARHRAGARAGVPVRLLRAVAGQRRDPAAGQRRPGARAPSRRGPGGCAGTTSRSRSPPSRTSRTCPVVAAGNLRTVDAAAGLRGRGHRVRPAPSIRDPHTRLPVLRPGQDRAPSDRPAAGPRLPRHGGALHRASTRSTSTRWSSPRDELWGDDAEPATVTLDLFESYLEKA